MKIDKYILLFVCVIIHTSIYNRDNTHHNKSHSQKIFDDLCKSRLKLFNKLLIAYDLFTDAKNCRKTKSEKKFFHKLKKECKLKKQTMYIFDMDINEKVKVTRYKAVDVKPMSNQKCYELLLELLDYVEYKKPNILDDEELYMPQNIFGYTF